jgi:hypothetical protein
MANVQGVRYCLDCLSEHLHSLRLLLLLVLVLLRSDLSLSHFQVALTS